MPKHHTGRNKGQHIVSSFDNELAELNQMIARLGGLAESQLAAAMAALETRNSQPLSTLIANDEQLDVLEYEINERVIKLIAMRSPLAQDLRRVIAVLKVAAILERIGDYAKNIAKRAFVVIEEETDRADTISFSRMAVLVQQILNQVLDAYATDDTAAAMEVRQRDAEIDQLHTSLFHEILVKISKNPEQVSAGSHMLFIAKNLERIGDYATGIAEQIYFLNTGSFPSDDRPKDDGSSTMRLSE